LIPCSEKSSWSLKTSFWKKDCPTNSKMAMKNFSHERIPCKSLNFMVLGHPSNTSQNYGNPCSWKIFMAIIEFVGQFFFQNDVFKLQKDFSEHGIRKFFRNGLGSFQVFLI
jgi:hypothetical protein